MLKFKAISALIIICAIFNIYASLKIEKINTLKPVLNFVDNFVTSGKDKRFFRKVLFAFDLHQALIKTEDICLRPFFEQKFNLLLNDLCNELNIETDKNLLKSEIIKKANVCILDSEITSLMSMLRRNEFKAIAISSDESNCLEELRIDQLHDLGIDFRVTSNPFKPLKNVFVGTKDNPLFKDGFLFCRDHYIDEVLVQFLMKINKKIGWTPELIVFIGKANDEIKLMKDRLDIWGSQIDSPINIYYFEYTDSAFLSDAIDEDAVKIQLRIFLESGKWIHEKYFKPDLHTKKPRIM